MSTDAEELFYGYLFNCGDPPSMSYATKTGSNTAIKSNKSGRPEHNYSHKRVEAGMTNSFHLSLESLSQVG